VCVLARGGAPDHGEVWGTRCLTGAGGSGAHRRRARRAALEAPSHRACQRFQAARAKRARLEGAGMDGADPRGPGWPGSG